MSYFSDVERDLVVAARTPLTAEITAFDLVAHNGRDLPSWSPGAHVDVVLAAGNERQYSLCGDPNDRSMWRIAVLREDAGRGGSATLHDTVEVGQRLRLRGPRNHFTFEASAAVRYRFVAGGIGITPIHAMVAAADAAGADWTLDYAGRSRSTMAFADALVDTYGARVRLHAADTGARLDVASFAAALEATDAVFACGPARLLSALEATVPQEALHVERFEAKAFGAPVWQEPFDVELALTGGTVTVQPGQSVLEAIEAQAPEAMVLSSCRRGTCGTCEVSVLDGEVEHRDSVLTPLEQEGDTVMMVCVSRARCERLVLDL